MSTVAEVIQWLVIRGTLGEELESAPKAATMGIDGISRGCFEITMEDGEEFVAVVQREEDVIT